MKTPKFLIHILICFFIVSGCNNDHENNPQPTSNAKQITGFVFKATDNQALSEDYVAEIDEDAKTIGAEFPYGTNITALIPDIQISAGAVITPDGTQDFTAPVMYTITAQNGTTTNYTVVMTIAENPLLGVWKYADSVPFDFKYLEFNNEELTLYREDAQYKFRDRITGAYQSTDSTFTFDGVLYYSINGDSLVLADMQDGLVFVKDISFTEDDWAKPVTPNDSFVSPVNALTDFDFYDEFLWMGDGKEKGLYRIDQDTKKVIDTLMNDFVITSLMITPSKGPIGSILFQSFFSIPNTGSIFQYNFNINQAYEFVDGLYSPITGIVKSNQGYFVANDEHITKLQNSGIGMEQYEVDTDLKGLTLALDHLYVCTTNNYINVCSLDPFVTIATFRIIDIDSLGGIAYAGTHFWVSGKKKDDDTVSFYKVLGF